MLTAFQSTNRPRYTSRVCAESGLAGFGCHNVRSTPFSTSSKASRETLPGNAALVLWLATSSKAAWRLPGITKLAIDAAARAMLTKPRVAQPSMCLKGGGYRMPPFIGPITTGAPTPYVIEGCLGDTGMGSCTTSM